MDSWRRTGTSTAICQWGQWIQVRPMWRIIMPWPWITLLLCLFSVSSQYGVFAQNSIAVQSKSRMKRETSLNVTSRSIDEANKGGSPKSLDDLSLDDIPNMTGAANVTMCQGKYAVGEKFAPNCEERCRCMAGGKVICEPRCLLPLVRRGAGARTDPLCEERPSPDECCVVLTCPAEHTAEDKADMLCMHKNETFKVGATWNDGCSSVCTCAAGGQVDCHARCPPANATSDKEGCVSLPDRSDPCCTVVLCDVNLVDPDDGKMVAGVEQVAEDLQLSSADALNSTAVIVHFVGQPMLDVNLTAEASEDMETWKLVPIQNGVIAGLNHKFKLVRVVSAGRRSNSVTIQLPSLNATTPAMMRLISNASTAQVSHSAPNTSSEDQEFCTFKGHNYTLGEEFNDECVSFCICTDTGVDCSAIECPSEFGLDVLDPACLRWETRPRDFTPKPPNCCSDNVRCLDDGACTFMDHKFPNWAELPSNITGCEQKCYCELGNVTCQNVCPPVAPSPPSDLPCPAAMAQLQLYPGDACCRFWVCPPSKTMTKFAPNNSVEESTKSSLDLLASFGLDEYGEPTESVLPGPVRLPPHAKYPIPDAAHLPGPPYGLQHGLGHFLSTKDEGIHGPPPFIIKPSKHDIKHKFSDGKNTKKPGNVVLNGNDDDLSSLVGPFPLHPPLVGNVYVSQAQNKPLAHDEYHAPGAGHNTHVLPPSHSNQLPFFHVISPQHPEDSRITFKDPQQHTAPNLSVPEHTGGGAGGVVVQVLEPLDEHTVRLAFSVPPILVGLHGRVEVRYTPDKHEHDPATWERQVLAPPGDLIATPQLHFDLGNLIPDTTYSIFIKVILRGISNPVESPVLTVRTPPGGDMTTLPPQISIDPQLSTAQVNASWATLKWRKFTDFELQFIDGLQLRFREHGGKVFSATPLIHRSVTLYSLPDLRSNTSYEVGLFFIPFPGQTTELQSDKNVNFVTSLESDVYQFDIQLDIVAIKSTGVEVTWTGVPYPEDKYVNIYRVIYQSESGKEDFNSFKVAKRDSTPKITVLDLKPTTRYRLWLEAYLTNGRTKKSNVQDFVTKPGILSGGPLHSGKLAGSTSVVDSDGDYYGPLVAVAVLAALAIMAALILLLVLMKKNGQNKAPISTRKTQSAYDNPSYKISENDMPLNGNGAALVEAVHTTDTTTVPC